MCFLDYLSELNKQIKTKKKYTRRKKSPSTKSSRAPKESKTKKKKEPEYEELNTEKSSESAIPSPSDVPPLQGQHNKQDEITSEDNFEDSGFKEFKMPENFDFPLDYIQEIVPKMNTSRDSDTASNVEPSDISRPLSPLIVDNPTIISGNRRQSHEALKVISPGIRDSSPLSTVDSKPEPIMPGETSNIAVDLPAVVSSPLSGERGSSPVLRHGTSSPEHITYYVRDNSSRKVLDFLSIFSVICVLV